MGAPISLRKELESFIPESSILAGVDSPEVILKGLTWTGRDSLGEYLRHHGVVTDDRVGVFMDTCPEYIIACIGALKAGAAFMPLALESPDNLLKSILAEATPRVIITKQKYISRLVIITRGRY